jgi:hypothetical protein
MHPANILMSSRGPVIVDWFDAAVGSADADLARSSLLMRPPVSSDPHGSHLSGATRDLLDRLHRAYVSVLERRGVLEARTFSTWEAVLAVARMSEPVPTADLVSIWRQWRATV